MNTPCDCTHPDHDYACPNRTLPILPWPGPLTAIPGMTAQRRAMEPVFDRADPDDELYPCPEDECEALVPLAGEGGIVRHMLARHPEDYRTRAIFRALVEVQLLRADDAAEVAR